MKNILLSILILIVATSFWGCNKTGYGNYPGGEVSKYIPIYDLRALYKGQDVELTTDNLLGSTSIAAVVVSDHSGSNLPDNLLVVQDARRLSQLRGISIDLGADAKSYTPGDSVLIDITGGTLKRVNNILQISGLSTSKINKLPNKVSVVPVVVQAANIARDPERYESTLLAIVDGSFLPLPQPGDILLGDKTVNDGTGNVLLHTNAAAPFANNPLYGRANYFGIAFITEAASRLVIQVRPRVSEDIILLNADSEPQAIIISGFMSDVRGGDGNYEYVQLFAVRDINFAVTPYSVVVTNNAGASNPTGFPQNGWGTGGQRTFKFNLTTGTAAKGTFFYVGGSAKMINGASSTSMATSNWIRSFNYVTTDGDGFGNRTSGLFANSGNASGVAVFNGIVVDSSKTPIDVVMVGSGGNLYSAGPPTVGYKIADNDLYKTIDLITLKPQRYYRSGTNTNFFPYSLADQGYFNQLGGKYNTTMGRWTEQRQQLPKLLEKTSPVSMIEDSLSTKLMRIEGSLEVEDK